MKIVLPGEESRGLRISHIRGPRDAVLESRRRRYIPLSCGDCTTVEDDLFFSNYRPDPKKSWCENCSKWVLREVPPKPEPLPLEPLF